MVPLEAYWPAEMLARVFPNEYGHLLNASPSGDLRSIEHHVGVTFQDQRYTVEQRGGCTVVWLGEKALGKDGAAKGSSRNEPRSQ